MLERTWRSRFLKRLVNHVDETARRQKQIALAKEQDLEVPLKADHEHARLFPYDIVEQQQEAQARRGAMGRFPTAPKPKPVVAAPKKSSWKSEPIPAKPTSQSGWHWTKPR